MFKRILSMILCITLVCLIAMPVTAEETKETKQTQETTRSMEEILNDYHARSAALTAAGANSRSPSTYQKTQLKQETIAELNAAGYSAQRSYSLNITSSLMGQVYDYSVGDAVQYVGPQFFEEIKSEDYDNLEDLKEYAAIAFAGLYTSEDNIGDIPVYHEGVRVYTFYEPDIV